MFTLFSFSHCVYLEDKENSFSETLEYVYQITWYQVLENCSLVYEYVKMFVIDFVIPKGVVAWLCDKSSKFSDIG
jgi:hypothetical protein